jgi:hypothetical protein
VPSLSIIRSFEEAKFPKALQPGVIDEALRNKNKDDYIVSFDGKKLVPGLTSSEGDIDLFGHEEHETATSARVKLNQDLTKIDDLLASIDQVDDEGAVEKCVEIVIDISNRVKNARAVRLKEEMRLSKLTEKNELLTGDNYNFAMSSIRSTVHQIEETVNKTLNVIGQVTESCSQLSGSTDFVPGIEVAAPVQSNWIQLCSPDYIPDTFRGELKYTQQRSDQWVMARAKFKVTGSTLHNALGLRNLKEQKSHYDYVVHGKKNEITKEVSQRMNYGNENEINAIATLVGVVIPYLFPHLAYVEVGSYEIPSPTTGKPLLFVSPDGCLMEKANSNAQLVLKEPLMACEFKCPTPSPFKEPVHYSIPPYYVCQLLSEMAALNVQKLVYLCYGQKSSTVFLVDFDSALWYEILEECDNLYSRQDMTRPTKTTEFAEKTKLKLKDFVCRKVTFLAEFPSRKSSTHNPDNTSKVPHQIDLPYRIKTLRTVNSSDDSTAPSHLSEALVSMKDSAKSLHHLQRKKSSEVVVWLAQSTNREYNPEMPHSIPIAYALQGYSLSVNAMRNMSTAVLDACSSHNCKVVGMAFHGQAYCRKTQMVSH